LTAHVWKGIVRTPGPLAKMSPRTGRPHSMLKVQLTNFRCFYGQPELEIRPITFLVGENSAGKTTFMAAVRVLMESFNRSPQNPFNRDPYFLGGFDQIAHYRGGVKGRAKSFCLEVTVPAGAGTGLVAARKTSTKTRHKLTFVKGSSPQPELNEYEFTTPDANVVLNLTSKALLKLIVDGKEKLTYEPKRLPPSAALRKDLSYLRYIFDEINFGGLHQAEGANSITQDLGQTIQKILIHYSESIRALQRRIFASAPVRTQPLRTYTPSEIESSSEGAHVPLEMARQKASSPTEWEGIHGRLKNFGQNSGLFDDVDIRSLGNRDGDPFQVIVKTKGQPFNLVDVGYGVSQALPIIYQLEQPRQHDTFFLQQPEVHLHPRAQAELGSLISTLSKQRANSLFMLETHSDYIIDRVRMEVKAGKVDYRNVTIIFFDKHQHEVQATNIYLSDKGEILWPPDNFRAFFLEEHSRLLGI
jgi:AAA domain, putative AbiEii toxin, Type IV TA system/AAA domain